MVVNHTLVEGHSELILIPSWNLRHRLLRMDDDVQAVDPPTQVIDHHHHTPDLETTSGVTGIFSALFLS